MSEFHANGKLPRRSNSTFITLIPKDSWRWLGDSSGEFSVRSAYKALIAEYASAKNDEVSNSIWLTPVPPKVQMCVWRMVNEGLPSVDNLARRNITLGEQ
uniref:Reverse transcriptase zinc-binding domain-containing protein n=1 Tax=Cajanus cajan TaxID=3821 RepID=A0A151S128_CAJCA|nr:hypothetical protein KK1_029804 [Cajanus cajan]